ncbi:MAG TPA: hypothetical protein VG370_05480 [Chloroflexota bacterium]|nr:hypothetical protein [Chloroflexota bacterium]
MADRPDPGAALARVPASTSSNSPPMTQPGRAAYRRAAPACASRLSPSRAWPSVDTRR